MQIERHDFSSFVNLDELNYRENIQPSEAEFDSVSKWEARIRSDNRLAILPRLCARGLALSGEGLDLGAGVCWLTAQLSALPDVTRVHSLEFSSRMLIDFAPSIIERLGGNKDKISLHIGDIHHLSMFGDSSLDFIAASAVLHHSSNLNQVLTECRRVLRPNGVIFAIREPGIPRILTPFTREQSLEHFGKAERDHGVTDQTFYENEWRLAFESTGFEVRFVKIFVSSRNWRSIVVRFSPLRWTNGLFFWSKAIIAHSTTLPASGLTVEFRSN